MYQVLENVPALHSEGWGLCERLELLLLHGADVNAAGVDSNVALHFASRLRRAQK
jgi:ankyrin repeat protein